MKNVNITVECKNPVKELASHLQKNGAKNIVVRRTYGDEIEVRYTFKAADPEKQLTNMFKSAGAERVYCTQIYNGMRFNLSVSNMVDERMLKNYLVEELRKNKIRVY